jgi:hypothetical protein
MMYALVKFTPDEGGEAGVLDMLRRLTETVAGDVHVQPYEPLPSCVACPECGSEVDTRTAERL